jgi:pimeloyl-[acyl-carrier protein] methyl ester esterase
MSRLHVEVTGTGKPLVLWHGWGMNLRVFDGLRDSLAATHRVFAVDLPGHGRSAWPRAADVATQLDLLLETVPENAVLLGWSLGSQLALRAARAVPERVRALVLLNATPRFVSGADWPHGVDAAVLERFAEGLKRNYLQTVTDFLDLQLRGSGIDGQRRQAIRDTVSGHGFAQPAALAAGLQMLSDHDLRADASAVMVPTLVIGGQHDRVTPPGAAIALSEIMPGARHVEIPRAAHAPFLSHPAELLTALHEFLHE